MSELNDEQCEAYEALCSNANIFLTGAAGAGKSFVLRKWLEDRPHIPVLASTGAAAILIGGRTFHGFFGLGIMKGGVDATISEALSNPWLIKRMKRNDTIIIDEISMISGPVLRAAECIAREARARINNYSDDLNPEIMKMPWGGMRVIVVGDFSQLPPVNPHVNHREWAFLDPVWAESNFQPVVLRKVMRTSDAEFLGVLNKVRIGVVDNEVREFLQKRTRQNSDTNILRLFSRKENTEKYNLERLAELPHPLESFKTLYKGDEFAINIYGKNLPIPNNLQLKIDAFVMLRTNDPEGRWVNGSLGVITAINRYENEPNLDSVHVCLEHSGRTVRIERVAFECLDKDGEVVLTAVNFPMTLAWASTIHKAQGITVDRLTTDIRKLWEPGQAYVALSRCKSADGLFLEGWNPSAIFADKQVIAFYREIGF